MSTVLPGSQRTHLWREIQEMGGRVSGEDMHTAWAHKGLAGNGWARLGGCIQGYAAGPVLW